MTHRDTLRQLLIADRKDRRDILTAAEFKEIGFLLIYPRGKNHTILLDLLIRDAATDGAFLLQGERDALLHVINGGNLDDALGTDTGCVAADHHGGDIAVVFLPGDDSGA